MSDKYITDYGVIAVNGKEKGIVNTFAKLTIENDTNCELLGCPYAEAYEFNDFLLTDYIASDGIYVKNRILNNGNRVSVRWDVVRCTYEYFLFDRSGQPLKAVKYYLDSDVYEETTIQPDGTTKTETHYTVFKPILKE